MSEKNINKLNIITKINNTILKKEDNKKKKII